MNAHRPLPKPGQKIHCDPNRDEGNTPGRWRNPNRRAAKVVAILDDDGDKLIVFKWWSPRRGWMRRVEDELWWRVSTQWQTGPLPKPPRGA